MISAAGTRPLPSAVGSRRSEMMAWRLAASWWRTCSCWCGGYIERMRATVSLALVVWMVEKTMWPVSAAVSAIWMVSRSRISPTSTTSGSWRSAARRALANDFVSTPSSRCETTAWLSRWTNSIGSSMVMMWTDSVWLMWSIIEASAVDLPEPVTPVTRIRPRRRSARSWITSGRPRVSKGGTWPEMWRMASAGVPRCLKAFTRKRPMSRAPTAKSSSSCSSNAARCWRVMMSARKLSITSGVTRSDSGRISEPRMR